MALKTAFRRMAGLAADSSSAAAAFRALEHQNWQKAVAAYDKGFGPLTSQCIPAMLKEVQCTTSTRLLDVATGTGVVTQAAVEKSASVVGVDFSANMLHLAKQKLSESGLTAEFLEADATQLPLPDASFDAVVCSFGVLHLATPDAFFKEAGRILRPGGRLAFTVWAPPPATEAFGMILNAIKEKGNPDVPLPPGPPFFKYADAQVVSESLSPHGFQEIETKLVPQVWEVDDPEEVFVAFRDGTGRTAATLAGQTAEQLEAVKEALLSGVRSKATSSGKFQMQMPCMLSVGRKAG
eukprot:TRINITY_DN102633_c0_g1_i1.p1 TRINITY_DN102633_c0_g1~~TRINITY_DN102633_c0_g1_i1.p1  ORF type:complete len:295 (-),score=75.40 TRINITY_DN102633_c0_g1_i1:191-1075(-)